MKSYWDHEAPTYDNAPDHGLADPAIRARWTSLLEALLPAAGRVLDIGCGTGSLSLLAAIKGHKVVGLDSSAEMLRHATAKAVSAGLSVDFVQGDAATPPGSLGEFDAILGRHIIWALPDPAAALQRWWELLVEGGRLVSIEGCWSTGVGLTMDQVVAALPTGMLVEQSFSISTDRALWGHEVTDERFAVVSTKQARH